MSDKGTKTQQRILEQAYRLFAAKGLQAVTMTDICRQTGLSRGGLYRYYTGSDQIFRQILSRQHPEEDRIQRQDSPRQILQDLLSHLEQEILDKEQSLSLAIYEYANLVDRQLFLELHQQAKQRWMRLIQYGMETGQFRQVNPDQVSDLILYYYQGLRLWSRVIPLEPAAASHYIRTIQQLLLPPEA